MPSAACSGTSPASSTKLLLGKKASPWRVCRTPSTAQRRAIDCSYQSLSWLGSKLPSHLFGLQLKWGKTCSKSCFLVMHAICTPRAARQPRTQASAWHRLDRSNLTIRAMGDLGVAVFLGFSCRSGGLARILPKLHLLAPPSSQSREEQSRRATLACTGM